MIYPAYGIEDFPYCEWDDESKENDEKIKKVPASAEVKEERNEKNVKADKKILFKKVLGRFRRDTDELR